MKTVCVLILGWLLFDSQLTIKNILGMALAVVGMVVYSWAVEVGKKQADSKPIIPFTKDVLTEEDIKLLKEGVEVTTVKDVEAIIGLKA